MAPFGLNANRLAWALRVPPPTIYEIVEEQRAISSRWRYGWRNTLGRRPSFK